MFNANQTELQAALQELEQASYNHEQWSKDLTRTLVCRLQHDHRDVLTDAHRQCRFGQWYDTHSSEQLRGHPAFIALGVAHERMHQVAGNLLRDMATGASISPKDYDNFANCLERMRLEIHALKHELAEFLFRRDPLTGAESRLGMLTTLRDLSELVRRKSQECVIAIMDIDHFKAINDSHGHLVGDKVLCEYVRYVIDHIRPYDKVFRYGGEEFLICMQNTDLQTGHVVIERLREGLGETAIVEHGNKPIFATASFGITLLDPDIPVEESIDRADQAMYAAKASGRNATHIWNPSMSRNS